MMGDPAFDSPCAVAFKAWIEDVKANFGYILAGEGSAAWSGWVAGWNTGRQNLEEEKQANAQQAQ